MPCHRVTSAAGLGGFANAREGWLLDVKRWLASKGRCERTRAGAKPTCSRAPRRARPFRRCALARARAGQNTLAGYRSDLARFWPPGWRRAHAPAAAGAGPRRLPRRIQPRRETGEPALADRRVAALLPAARQPQRSPRTHAGDRHPRAAERFPKTLSEAQVEALLAAPRSTPARPARPLHAGGALRRRPAGLRAGRPGRSSRWG